MAGALPGQGDLNFFPLSVQVRQVFQKLPEIFFAQRSVPEDHFHNQLIKGWYVGLSHVFSPASGLRSRFFGLLKVKHFALVRDFFIKIIGYPKPGIPLAVEHITSVRLGSGGAEDELADWNRAIVKLDHGSRGFEAEASRTLLPIINIIALERDLAQG